MKFRTRLFLFYIIGVGLMTFVLAAYFVNFEESRVRRSWHDNELVQAKLVAANFIHESQLKDSNQVSAIVNRISKATDGRITIINADGAVLGDSRQDYRKMENHRNRPEIKTALQGKIGSSSRYSKTLKYSLIYLAYPIWMDGKIIGAVRIAKEQRDLNQLLFRFKFLIIGSISLTAMMALIFGILIMHRITKPILELKQLAFRIASGDLSGRVKIFGQDEIADLGFSFNQMAEKLTESFTVIREEKRKLEVILENLADGILVIDRDLKIILMNPAAQTILGLSSKNIQGRPILEVVFNHHFMELIQEVNQFKLPFESELQLYYPDNKQVQVFLAPLKEDNGELTGSIVVLNDLTQLRRLERVRQDFVANVSHELRTPITSIKAMSETLLAGASTDQAMLERYLRAIDQESDRLTNLVNDLLDLAKLDSKVPVENEIFDLRELLTEVKERFVALSDQSPHFDIKIPVAFLPRVKANRDQIKQVLINLLDNAFKYTPKQGEVRLSAWPEGEMVKVAVADTGIGIPQADLGRIFERFYRVDKARAREQGGTGLGLSIVKHIVESYGGKIEVESTLNHGSVFTFTLETEKT